MNLENISTLFSAASSQQFQPCVLCVCWIVNVRSVYMLNIHTRLYGKTNYARLMHSRYNNSNTNNRTTIYWTHTLSKPPPSILNRIVSLDVAVSMIFTFVVHTKYLIHTYIRSKFTQLSVSTQASVSFALVCWCWCIYKYYKIYCTLLVSATSKQAVFSV